jgi:CheY-like chemotaxis protein
MEKTLQVLLVDDNDDDAFFVERAFKSCGTPVHITRCIDGQEAINYLDGKPPFTKASFHPRPDFVLLDLKLPYKDGLSVLAWIREQENFRNLIVVVLTSSSHKHDIERAYNLNANSYLTKPVSLEGMIEMARAINYCWFKTCQKLRE